MKKRFREYAYAIQARKVCILAVILVLAIVFIRNMPIYDEGCSSDENEASKVTDHTWSGRVKNIQKKVYNGVEELVVTIERLKPYEGSVYNTDDRYITGPGQTVIAYFDIAEDIKIGQLIVFEGRAGDFNKATNYGQFDSYSYNRNRGCMFYIKNANIIAYGEKYSRLGQLLYEFRDYCAGSIERIYGEEDGAILKAMLLGVKGEIEVDIQESFQKSGAAHILAISGLHISFLCTMLVKMLAKMGVGKYIRVSVGIAFLLSYVVMVGESPSAIRAGIMFIIYMISCVIKRSYDISTSMAVAAIVILITNPGYLEDAGVLLSFSAIVAVGVLEKNLIDNSCFIKKLRKMKTSDTISGILHNFFSRYILDAFITSGIIFLTTMPILLCNYYEVAFYSVLLNLLIIPLMSVLLPAAVASLVLTEIVYVFGTPFVFIVRTILWIYKVTCGFMEHSGLGRRNLGQPYMLAIVVYFILLILVCLYKGKASGAVRFVGVIMAILVISLRAPNRATLHMLDVGQGECLVFLNDNGKVYIFDGGSTSVREAGKRIIIPFLKYKAVDEVEAVFLSHPDADHINGIEELLNNTVDECINVKNLYIYEGFLECKEYKNILEAAGRAGTKVYGISEGYCLIDGELMIECLYPRKNEKSENLNNMSLVMKLEYKSFSMLETGDIEMEGEQQLLDKDIKCDCLKIAHHGSSSSTEEKLLEKTKCSIALISAGRNNSYGHPSKETMDKLRRNNKKILCTMDTGQISLEIFDDGLKIGTYN